MQLTRRGFVLASGAALTASCTPIVQNKQDADVLILGAGLAGLHAARMLEADGFKVIVLEADTRIGGRMWTLDQVPGRPEAGGQQVGQSYARIRSSAIDLGLNIVPPAPGVAREWAAAPENPFPDAFKRATPDAALFMAAAGQNPLVDQYAWREIGAEYDISAQSFLEQAGFAPASLALCYIALNANDLSTYSMLNLWRSLTLFAIDSSSGGSEEIEGGSQRLPEAMAASLSDGALKIGRRVSAIAATNNGVEVTADGTTYRAAFSVSSLPFPVLRTLALTLPEDAPSIQPIIDQMPYTQIQQVHLELEQAPTDDLPIMMWTDTPIERVFPVRNAAGAPVALPCWVNGLGPRPSESARRRALG